MTGGSARITVGLVSTRPSLQGWPTPDLQQCGVALSIGAAELIATERMWVRRRVEQFQFIDSVRVRRSMSCDLYLPPEHLSFGEQDGRHRFVLPLALPMKEPLRDFDVWDEDRRPLPLLTREENSAVATELLCVLAEEALISNGLASDLQDNLVADFALVAGYYPLNQLGESLRRVRARGALGRFQSSEGTPDEQRQRRLMWGDRNIRAFLQLLSERFMLLVPVQGYPDDRRVLKFSYEERLQTEALAGDEYRNPLVRAYRTAKQDWPQVLGLRTTVVGIATRAPYAAASYHAELEAPDELLIARAQLGRALDYVSRSDGSRRAGERIEVATEWRVHRAHLFCGGLRPTRRVGAPVGSDAIENGFLEFALVLRGSVLLGPLVASSVATSLLLTGAILASLGARSDHDASALLVAAPALFAAYLLPVGTNRLVRRMYVGLRGILVLVAIFAGIAAGFLALDVARWKVILAWWMLAILSALATGIVIRALVRD